MCLALYLASDHSLPIIPRRESPKDAMSSLTWPREAQRFHTAALGSPQEAVLPQLSRKHVLYAGSYEGCGCGFNFGRQYPDAADDAEYLTAARESVAELVQYVRDSRVQEIYSCWFDDETKPAVHQRAVTPEMLSSPDFFFRELELLKIDHDA